MVILGDGGGDVAGHEGDAVHAGFVTAEDADVAAGLDAGQVDGQELGLGCLGCQADDIGFGGEVDDHFQGGFKLGAGQFVEDDKAVALGLGELVDNFLVGLRLFIAHARGQDQDDQRRGRCAGGAGCGWNGCAGQRGSGGVTGGGDAG